MCWLYPDLPWGLPPTPEIQKNLVGQWRRGADFLKIWEFFTATACLYVGVMVPLTLGFERLYLKDEDVAYALGKGGHRIESCRRILGRVISFIAMNPK